MTTYKISRRARATVALMTLLLSIFIVVLAPGVKLNQAAFAWGAIIWAGLLWLICAIFSAVEQEIKINCKMKDSEDKSE